MLGSKNAASARIATKRTAHTATATASLLIAFSRDDATIGITHQKAEGDAKGPRASRRLPKPQQPLVSVVKNSCFGCDVLAAPNILVAEDSAQCQSLGHKLFDRRHAK